MSKVKTNNYMYQSKKKNETPQKNKKYLFMLIAAVGLLIVAAVALICIEQSMDNKIVVNNKSSHKITELEFWYEDDLGDYVDLIKFDNVEAKDKIKTSTPEVDLTGLDENICLSVHITFEDGGKTLLQTGEFRPDFAGKISFELSDSKDEDLILRLKAGEGLFNSTIETGCDDVYYINPKNGYIE